MRQPLDAFQDASYILIAGKDTGLLLAARGKFTQAPPGSTLVAPDLALAGTPGLVSSAIRQHKTGTSGAPALLSHASRRPMWIAADGTATFPLSGNTRNLNRFLHFTEYLTVTIQFGSPADIEITAVCRGPAEARHFEDSARAFLSLANLSGTPQIRPEGLTVRIAFAVSAATLQEWIGSALRP